MAQESLLKEQIYAAVRQETAWSWQGLLETTFSRLFLGLVYPQIWEDPAVDMAALEIGQSDHLVCIASGGCNVMSYLAAQPASITAVDLSPAHVALNRLKLTAAQHLPDYDSFYSFFGLADQPRNLDLYDTELAIHLDPNTRSYWETRHLGRRRISMFARGFYRFGMLGKNIGAAHLAARLGGVDLRGVLTANSLEEQRRFFDQRIEPLLKTPILRYIAARRLSLFGLGIPPAQYNKLAADGGGDVLSVLCERVRKLMCDFPVTDNYFAWQAFGRRYDPAASASLPPYLERHHFEAIRANSPKVRVLNGSLTVVLSEEPAASKHCYVLLDAQDWMTDAQLADLWREISRTAVPGARVIFRTAGRQDILPGRVPDWLLEGWHYDAPRSASGFAADRSAIYGGFHVYRLEQ